MLFVALAPSEPSEYRPLLTQRVRCAAVIVVVLAITVVVVLGLRYADQDMPGRLDRGVDALIRNHLRADQSLTRALVSLGTLPHAALLVAAVAGAAAAARRWSGVLLTVVGTVTATTITDLILKPLVGRLRFGHLSFPSGHTTVVAALAVASAILIGGARWPRGIAVRLLAGLLPLTLALGVAVSLVAQRIHYTTDTLAGYCVALATVLTVALLLDLHHDRHSEPNGGHQTFADGHSEPNGGQRWRLCGSTRPAASRGRGGTLGS